MASAASSGSADDTLAGYRPVSRLAVAAAVVGCASALALVSPLFWMLPIMGAAVAWAALVDVGRREAPKAGRLVALAGLALSLGFGAQAVSGVATAEWLARGRAEAAVRFWLEAVAAGRLDDARAMCAPDAAAAVDGVAAAGGAVERVRFHGRDDAGGGRVVRAVVAGRAFDVVLDVAPARQGEATERFTVVRCDAVTPSAN